MNSDEMVDDQQSSITLSAGQRAIASADWRGSVFLEGPAGAGKTTAGAGRLEALLAAGNPAQEILVIVPQRTLELPYRAIMGAEVRTSGATVEVMTFGGLARRMADIFWPICAAGAGFASPDSRPTFLSLETAQYYMARVVGPLIEREGYFASVTLDRNRIYSQILDNLNKAALVGFPHGEIGARLESSWLGDTAQQRVFADVQDSAKRFRQYCLDHNLLDFSLQAELLLNVIWPQREAQAYLVEQYRHLIVDNLEEDNPGMHDLLRDWLPACESALLIFDTQAGFRRFLGADERTAASLRERVDRSVVFSESWVTPPSLQSFATELAISLHRDPLPYEADAHPLDGVIAQMQRFHPQAIDAVVEDIRQRVHDHGVNPREIVVVAPYLSDSLRFALLNRLEAAQVPARSHRPSRALREEPAAQCLLTLAQLAHPEWQAHPAPLDVAYALMTAIGSLDLVRAQLLAQIVYRRTDGAIGSFANIKPDMQERITFVYGERYERLRGWLLEYAAGDTPPLDVFWRRLFGEVLSQEGFGFQGDYGAAEVAANLIDSAAGFRQTIQPAADGRTLAQEYVEMVSAGVIADQYLLSWAIDDTDAVLLAPAYTFLMRNRPVDYQYWLNVGSHGWAERLYQPLTHPYVLRRDWEAGRKWTDDDEVEANREAVYRLTLGLIRRCRRRIYLGMSQLGEQGQEGRGMLLDAVQGMLRRLVTARAGREEEAAS